MAEREKGNLPAARTKVRIVADAQSVGLLLHDSDNGTFDLAFVRGLDNDHLQPEAPHRGLRLLDVILHEARMFGFTRRAIRVAPGRTSCSSSIRLATSSTPIKVIPVTFPPGRPRLGTKPALTGSEAVVNTIGIVFVAAIAVRIATSGAPALMTATLRLTRSAAMAGSLSNSPSAQRYSMATLRPSAKPASPRPRWNPAMRSVHCAADTPCSTPITGIAGGCARAATGQAAAAPPSSVMKSRLLTRSPHRSG